MATQARTSCVSQNKYNYLNDDKLNSNSNLENGKERKEDSEGMKQAQGDGLYNTLYNNDNILVNIDTILQYCLQS